MAPAPLQLEFLEAVRQHQAGNLAQAEKVYHKVLAAVPRHPDALHLLGAIALQRGQSQAAVNLIRRAIEIKADDADYYANLGSALLKLEQWEPAADALKNALRLKPGDAMVHNNLGAALIRVGNAEAGAQACRMAIELDPNLYEAYTNLGAALNLMARPEEAIAAYRSVLRLKPQWASVHSDLIFAMLHHPIRDEKAIRAELMEWSRLHAAPLKHLIQPPRLDRSSNRRLRIGWVSADFRWHVVSRCLLPLLGNFDRQRFTHICYASVANPDDMTDRLADAADVWRDILNIPDLEAAKIIRSDRIDILVDLSLHTAGNRLTLFALKPAPVQVTYLGYCGSTGLDTMDYRISDPYIDPPDADLSGYSEQTVRLPNSFLCYSPEAPPPDVAPLPALANGYVTFGCLNNTTKVSTAVMNLWCRVLQAVPGSRLLLYSAPGTHQRNLLTAAGAAAIARDRIQFVPKQSWRRYMETYNRIDIALDPFPYGGGVTTCDALLMGVPVVTWGASGAAGRISHSVLCNIGQSRLSAATPEQYVAVAAHLATNLAGLADLRAALRSAIKLSPVMDAAALPVTWAICSLNYGKSAFKTVLQEGRNPASKIRYNLLSFNRLRKFKTGVVQSLAPLNSKITLLASIPSIFMLRSFQNAVNSQCSFAATMLVVRPSGLWVKTEGISV